MIKANFREGRNMRSKAFTPTAPPSENSNAIQVTVKLGK
jgi:hypothetical protein